MGAYVKRFIAAGLFAMALPLAAQPTITPGGTTGLSGITGSPLTSNCVMKATAGTTIGCGAATDDATTFNYTGSGGFAALTAAFPWLGITHLVGPAGATATSSAGGAFTNQPAGDFVQVKSSNAADTGVWVWVTGASGGVDLQEQVQLNGTAWVNTSSGLFDTVLAVNVSTGTALGTITVAKATGHLTITTIVPPATSAGLDTISVVGNSRIVNVVASGTSVKTIGLGGFDLNGNTVREPIALNDTTAVQSVTQWGTITNLYIGDLEAGRTITVSSSAGVDFYRPLLCDADGASSPCYSWLNSPGTGMFRPSANTIGFAANGSQVATVDATGYHGALASTVTATTQAPGTNNTTVATTAFAIANGGSPPFSDATTLVKNAADATKLFKIDASGVTAGQTVTLTPGGTAAAPTYNLGSGSSLTVGAGSQAVPAIRSTADADTGWWSSGTSWYWTADNSLAGAVGLTSGTGLILYKAGPTIAGQFLTDNWRLGSGGCYLWGSTTADATPDTGACRPAAGILAVGNGTVGNTSGTVAAAVHTSGNILAADTLPTPLTVRAQSSWSQSTGANQTGAQATYGGGIGQRLYTIVLNTGLATTTCTLTVNGTAVVLTATAGAPGANQFQVGSDDTAPQKAVTATNLAAAITAHATLGPLVTATASAANVYLDPKAGGVLVTLRITKSAADSIITATQGLDGGSVIAGPVTIRREGAPNTTPIFAVGDHTTNSAFGVAGTTNAAASAQVYAGTINVGGTTVPASDHALAANYLGIQPRVDDAVDLGIATSTNWRLIGVTRAIQGSKAKTLVDGSATIFAKVAVASGSTWGGDILFKLEGKDGTDWAVMEGDVHVSAINQAGTITCAVATPTVTGTLTTGGKTQTLTGFTCADATANVLNILVNYTDNMTDTANWPKIFHRLSSPDVATYTPQ